MAKGDTLKKDAKTMDRAFTNPPKGEEPLSKMADVGPQHFTVRTASGKKVKL